MAEVKEANPEEKPRKESKVPALDEMVGSTIEPMIKSTGKLSTKVLKPLL